MRVLKKKHAYPLQISSYEDGPAEMATTTTRKIVALTAAVCVDLSLFYAAGFGEVTSGGAPWHLARLWVAAALRCSAVTLVTVLALGALVPAVVRLVAVHCLLPAVFGAGAWALRGRCEGSDRGPAAADTVTRWLTCAGASLAAALFWEITFPDTGDDEAAGKEKKQKARVLFVRVVRMYRPQYPLMIGGFLFLSLAVICK